MAGDPEVLPVEPDVAMAGEAKDMGEVQPYLALSYPFKVIFNDKIFIVCLLF